MAVAGHGGVMTVGTLLKYLRCLTATALLVAAGSAPAEELSLQGQDLLLDTYRRNLERLESNRFGLPLFLESVERGNRVQVDVYGIFDCPFSSMDNLLTVPANWCDIVALHPNVKACTYQERTEGWLLTFYLGRKFYQPPDSAHQVVYQFRNAVQREGYLDIVLSAEAGPFGTRDHRIRFEALPLGGGKTFAHIGYGYRTSFAIRLAEKGYFATLGSGKVGFTVIGTDSNGQPVFIRGARGAIERNAVRYYFAIQAFMNTLNYPADIRFARRIGEWHEFAGRYPKQLFELEREDYLSYKIREHQNQVVLQKGLGTAL